MSDEIQYQPETLAVHSGQRRSAEGEMSEPIFASTSFVFSSAAEAAARFSGEKPGNIYSRFTNPTVQVFEQRIAAMEGGERAVATSSGMAAILATCLGLLKSGQHIVASNGIFGSTVILFNNYLAKFGIETTYAPLTDLAAWRAAIRPTTRILFLETPANPLTEVADIAQLAALAHEHGCLLVVDNTVCTSALQRPLQLGADLVVVSATKYIDGQGRTLGGAVLGSKEFILEKLQPIIRNTGPSLS
ncbi:MAG: aminotransferase class I/II-fold pyridoxal phosphate-dependent enzyme, partial [Pseudomonadota bacterium]